MFQYLCLSVSSVELHEFFLVVVSGVYLMNAALTSNAISPLFLAIVDDERLSAEEMDERRRQNIAYEYLCHLEEAKR